MAGTEKIWQVKIEGADRASKELGKVEADLKKITKQRTDLINILEKEGKLSKKQELDLQKLTKKQAGLRDEKNRYNAILRIEAKNNAALTTTYQKLSHALNENRKKYKDLALQNKHNTKAGKELLKTIKEQDKKLKDVDATVGQHQRNVGNYSGSIMDAAGSMGMMGGGLKKVKEGLEVVKSGFVSLKAAIISSGIGALLILVTSLFTYFTKTTKGARIFGAAMAGLGAAFDVVIDKLSTFGEAIFEIFASPQKYFNIFIGYIKQKIFPIFTGLGKIISGVFTLDAGEIREGAEQVSSAFSAVVDDVKVLGAKIKQDLIDDIIKPMVAAAGAAYDLKQRTYELKDAERELNVEIAKNKKEYQDLLYISRDFNKTYGERMAALVAAGKIEQDELMKSTKVAEEKLKVARAEADLNRKNNRLQEEDLEKIAELEIALYTKQAEITAKRRELKNREIELNNKWAAETKKAADEVDKYINKLIDEDLALLDEELAEGSKKVDEEMLERIQAYEEARALLDEGSTANFMEQLQTRLEALAKALAEGLITEEEYNKAVTKSKLQTAAMQIGIYSDQFAQIGSMFEEGTKEAKAFAIVSQGLASAEAAINTYLAATAAYSAMAGIPVVGPALGAIAAAVAIAAGLANIAKINAVKFEDGGMIGGKSHSQGGTTFTGSDGSSFEAERGEFLAIVNKRDAETAEAYSRINSNHGRSYFADGGTFTPEAAAQDNNLAAVNALRAELADLRVYVVESDISEMQNHVEIVENEGDF